MYTHSVRARTHADSMQRWLLPLPLHQHTLQDPSVWRHRVPCFLYSRGASSVAGIRELFILPCFFIRTCICA